MLAAALEMSRPLFGSTLATMVVFVPLAFISGVTGGFFKALAITMVAALGVSLLYARYVLPLVADRWLTLKDAEAADRAEGFLGAVKRRYAAVAQRSFARPGIASAVVVMVLIVVGYMSWSHVQSGFMPKMDEGGFILDYKAKPGAALSDTDRLLRQVEKIIRETPEVTSYSRRTGLQLGGGLTEADEGDFFIRLNGGSRRNIEDVMTEIADKVQTQVPGLQIETAQLMEDLIGDLTAVPQPIEVKLFSDDPVQLEQERRKLLTASAASAEWSRSTMASASRGRHLRSASTGEQQAWLALIRPPASRSHRRSTVQSPAAPPAARRSTSACAADRTCGTELISCRAAACCLRNAYGCSDPLRGIRDPSGAEELRVRDFLAPFIP